MGVIIGPNLYHDVYDPPTTWTTDLMAVARNALSDVVTSTDPDGTIRASAPPYSYYITPGETWTDPESELVYDVMHYVMVSAHIIVASTGAHGSISPSGSVSVDDGGAQSFTIEADSHYYIVGVLVDSMSAGAVSTYDFTNVTGDHTISASFSINTYTIEASVSGSNGSVDPSSQSIDWDGTAVVDITPDAYCHISDVLVDTVSVGTPTSYTFENVTETHTLVASFEPDSYTVTAFSSTEHGTTSPSIQTVNYGENATVTITPDAHYRVASVSVDGVYVGTPTSYTFEAVSADHSLVAAYTVDTYTVSASVENGHGTVSPSTSEVDRGDDITLAITPSKSYYTSGIVDNGVSVPVGDTYTIHNVTENHTVIVSTTNNPLTSLSLSALEFPVSDITQAMADKLPGWMDARNNSLVSPITSTSTGDIFQKFINAPALFEEELEALAKVACPEP